MPTAEEYRAHGEAPFGFVRAEQFEPTAMDAERHAVEGYVSTDVWARDGQRILPEAWRERLDVYLRNPIVTWAHSWWEIPIGLAPELRIDDRGLWARLEIDVEDEIGARVWQAITSRRLRTTSVSWDGQIAGGWNPRAGDHNEFGEWVERPDGGLGFEWRSGITLFEVAVVPIPADTEAVFSMARGMGLQLPRTGLAGAELEDARVMEDLKRLAGAAESLRNWNRHLERDGGAPSPDVLQRILSPISDLVEIAAGRKREGKVLSATNLQLVQDAYEALGALIDAAGGERGSVASALESRPTGGVNSEIIVGQADEQEIYHG